MVLHRIAVGTDGSAVATAALRWAAQIAAPVSAEIVAINAFVEPYAEMSPEALEEIQAEHEAQLAGPWTGAVAGARLRGVVRCGDPRDVVARLAEEEGADLLVLGRTGSGGGPGFLHLGSVVEHAVHHATVPVAVIPAGDAVPPRRIVVGIDGSEGAQAAVDWLVDVAPGLGATVVAVEVADPLRRATPDEEARRWREDAERRLEARTAALVEAGVAVERVVIGELHPADALLGVAGARQADLLVVGTRGLGGFTGLRAGGVALKVLHRAHLGVVIVPGG